MKSKILFTILLITAAISLSSRSPALAIPPYDGGAGDGASVGVAIHNFATNPSNPQIVFRSSPKQAFYKGDNATEISPITISQGTDVGITKANAIRIRIPPELKMTWDTGITTIILDPIKTVSMTKDKVNTAVSYSADAKTLIINLTSDFELGDSFVFSGPKFNNFNDYSYGKLSLDIFNTASGSQYFDSTYKTIGPTYSFGDGWELNESTERYFNNPPSITAPVIGAKLLAGNQYAITWVTTGFSGATLKLQYWTASANTWIDIIGAENLAVTSGSFNWVIPLDINLGAARVRFIDNTNPDITKESAEFEIVGKFVWNIPAGGESWQNKVAQPVKWTTTGVMSAVKLEYIKDGGQPVVIAASYANNPNAQTTYSWTPAIASNDVVLRVSDLGGSTVSADSQKFTISGLELLSPNGAEEWEVGRQHSIQWQAGGSVANDIKIVYSKDGGSTWPVTIATNQAATDIYGLYTPQASDISSTAKIKVYSESQVGIYDVSNANFKIVAAPKITVTAPAQGTSLEVGSNYMVKWSNTGRLYDTVNLFYSTDGQNWTEINSSPVTNSGSTGQYNWTNIPVPVSTNVSVKVVEAGVPTPARETNTVQEGVSEIFSVTQPSITITSPTAADIWAAGDKERNITWSTKGTVGKLSIYYSIGGVDQLIAGNVTNSGSFNWSLIPPEAASDSTKIRIVDESNPSVTVDSPDFKILSGPTIIISSPNGGESLIIGNPYTITWNMYGEFNLPLTNKVKLEYVKYDANNNIVDVTPIVSNIFNGGTYNWPTVNDDTSEKVKIRITCLNDDYTDNVSDTSDAYFSIMLPSVTMVYPNGGETLYANGKYDVTWTKDGTVDDLVLEYSTDNGATWTNFYTVSGAAAVAAGKYTWTVPDSLAGKSCLIQARDPGRATTTDVSDAKFNVIAPTFSLTAPKTGDSWVVGTDHSITWQATGDHNAISNNLKLQYSKDGATFTDITIDPAKIDYGTPDASGIANGSYLWTVADAVSASGVAKIKIFDTTHTSTAATSEAFTIAPPSISVTAPKLGDKWIVGTNHNITWASGGIFPDNSLTLEYTTDGANWLPIQGATGIDYKTGSFSWDIPAAAAISDACKIRITDMKRSDKPQFASEIFSISVPVITVDYPKGGELVTLNDSSEMIRWTTEGKPVGDLKLEYSLDNFASSIIPIATVSNTLTEYPLFQSGVNYPLSASYRVRITDTGRTVSTGKSSANFTVLPVPEIALTSPNGAENWIMGTQQQISWTDNGGKISNDLKFEYTVNGTNWFSITPNAPYDPTAHACLWSIPDADINGLFQSPFNNVRIKITDNKNEATFDVSDNVFNIKLPTIEITSPVGGEYWAYGDSAPVKWKTTGSVSNNLIFYYSTDNGTSWSAPITSGAANTGAYSWSVPNDPSTSVKFKIVDGERQNALAISNSFNIIAKPVITLDSPKAGDTYVLGETLPIAWSTKGLSVGKLTITYSADNFVTEKQIAGNVDSASGSYSWSIPLDAFSSPNIKLKLTSDNPNVDPVISGAFRLRGGFTITAPKATDTWGAKSPQTIQWSTKGSISKVNIDYSLDSGSSWNSIASSTDNTGSYSWTLPDLVNTSCRLRISDSSDSTIYVETDFKIDYYTISWRILDYDTYTDISTLSVKDALWSAIDVDSPTGTIHKYPYGSYTTFWSKGTEYPERSTVWVANADKTVTVYLESAISAQIEWHVLLSTSYAAGTDSLRASSWLERRGKMVGLTDVERADLKKAVLQVYDGDTLVKELTSTTPDSQGVFSFNWDNSGLTAGKSYFVKAQITYREGVYTSGGNIDVTAAKEQQTAKEELSAQLGVATMDIKSAVGDVKAAVETKAEEVKAQVAAVKAETGQILTATGTTLPAQITAVQEAVVKEIKPSVQSGILNRETSVKIGSSMTVSYRTTTGLAPVISVYDPKNVLKVASRTMKEIGTTGVYEYDLKFENSWGIGDFTIVCSESTQGTADALAISVVRHDLEEISGQVSGILGTTSSLTGLGDIVNTLNSQFALIDKALANLGQGISGEVSKTKGVVNDLESVYNQLTSLSGQIKKIGGTQGVSLEKLYKVSKDKKDDITYLKNKAQELKATMEINQKMMQNVANKPVVQSWFEFK